MNVLSVIGLIAIFILGFSAVIASTLYEKCLKGNRKKAVVLMRRTSASILAFSFIFALGTIPAYAENAVPCDTNVSGDVAEEEIDTSVSADFELDAKSAVLMEASTGKILYEMNPEEGLPPASVTKIMTLLLVMEALDTGTIALQDAVTVSAYAASMGGSQVFLEEGEQMTVEDLLKCTVISSANDAAVALAEYLMGSEAAFVAKMNDRAAELGLKSTHFENVTGLDDDTQDHRMSAGDIAVISKELISHKKILEYSSVWMDTIRNGEFTLTNTNRLVRYYEGANGLKTGSTDKAKFCITATAERSGMTLIAVIMGAPSRDIRNTCAKTLFDWGFANYTLYQDASAYCGEVPVVYGKADSVATVSDRFSVVVPKSEIKNIERVVSLSAREEAPVASGDVIGTISYIINGNVIGCVNICAQQSVERLNYWGILGRLFKIFILS